MHALEPIRAWSRACHLVIEHYPTATSCSDPLMRESIVHALLALPVSLAQGTAPRSSESLARALYLAQRRCSEITTHLYIARELRFIEPALSDKFITDSMLIADLLKSQASSAEQCANLHHITADIAKKC